MKNVIKVLLVLIFAFGIFSNVSGATPKQTPPTTWTHLLVRKDTLWLVDNDTVRLRKGYYLPVKADSKKDSIVYVRLPDKEVVQRDSTLGNLIVREDIVVQVSITADVYRTITKSRKDSSIITMLDTIRITIKDTLLSDSISLDSTFIAPTFTLFIADKDSFPKFKDNLEFAYPRNVNHCLFTFVSNKDSVMYIVRPTIISNNNYVGLTKKSLWMIYVGIALLLIIGVGLGCFFFLRWRKKDNIVHNPQYPEPIIYDDDNNPSQDDKAKEIENLKNKVNELTTAKQKLEQDLKSAQNEKNDAVKSTEKEKKRVNELEAELTAAKKHTEKAVEEARNSMQVAVDQAKSAQKEAEDNLSQTRNELRSTKNTLESTELTLNNTTADLRRLEDAQKEYTTKIVFVPYATAYAQSVMELLFVVDNLEKKAADLLKGDFEDPYHLYKAIAKYKSAMTKIDLSAFYSETSLAAQKQMTFAGSVIANLGSLHGNEQQQQIQEYFMLNYLTPYVTATQIFVESMIGLPRLMGDVAEKDVADFVNARNKLEKLYEKLNIVVICPHLFDSIGNNIDLHVELVDTGENSGFESGEIIEINYCWVYPVNGKKPIDKILVKAQK